MFTEEEKDEIRGIVRGGYKQTAAGGTPCCAPGCCGAANGVDDNAQLALQLGYSSEELAVLPDGANMGLSCGNPSAIASLKAGDVVMDLGSGGGFDVFIAGKKVRQDGRVIGVDMTPEMITKARNNAVTYRNRTRLDNVEFRLGEIEHLPAADNSIDVLISNCVLNLSPDKPQVWKEIARVLKPGGRVSISDMALLKPLPLEVRKMAEALISCIAGAELLSNSERFAREAGLAEIEISPQQKYVEILEDSKDPLYAEITAMLPLGSKLSDFITSAIVSARKPLRQ